MDPSLKDRESQVEDDQPAENGSDPAIEVSHDGENTTVQPLGVSKEEDRRRKWATRVGGVIDERNKPLLDNIEHMKRTIEGMNQSLMRLGKQPAQQREAPSDPQVDPEFMRIRRRQGEIMKLMPSCKTQAEVDRLEGEYYKLDQEALDARAGALADQRIDNSRRSNPAPNPEMTVIQSEFPDVIADQRAAAWASLEFQRAVMEADGKPFDRMATHRRVLGEAAIRYKIRQAASPPPRAHEQARFGGAPPASGAGGATKGGYRLSKDQQEIARSRFNDDAPEVADRKWAESMLKRDPHFFG